MGQIIDTMENTEITLSDSVNRFMNIVDAFEVEIQDGHVVNRKGLKVRYGLKKYYLHVVKSPEVRISGAKIANRGKPIYLLVVAEQKRLARELEPRSLWRAQFLKGMIDNCDSLIKAMQEQIQILKKEVDSLKKVSHTPRKLSKQAYKRRKKQRVVTSADSTARLIAMKKAQIKSYKEEIRMYQKFKQNKGSKSAPKFFTRHHFRKSFMYDIYGQVYGLPSQPDFSYLEPPVGEPKTEKHSLKSQWGVKLPFSKQKLR
jgi:hypothetical protein